MPDPTYITFAQQHDLYDLLGLDPDLLNDTASVLIEPMRVVVTRYCRDENGQKFLDDTGKPATDISVLDVVRSSPHPTWCSHEGEQSCLI
jgi:hypothetical protein